MNEYKDASVPETEEETHVSTSKHKHIKLRRWIGRIAAFLLTIVLVAGAVYLVANRDTISVSSVQRAVRNLFSGSDQAESIRFKGDGATAVTSMEGGLLVCSKTDLELYTQAGKTAISEAVNFTQPVVQAAGSYAVAYDAGGADLYLIYSEQILRTYTASKKNGLLGARVNANGYLTIVERATGYKAAVTVYTSALEPVVTENISSAFVSDAALSADNKTLAAVTMGEDTSGFDSVVVFYNVSDGTELYRCTLGNDVVLDLKWEKNGLWVMGEYGAYYLEDGTVKADSVDAGRNLQAFSLSGDHFAAFCTAQYQSGGSTTVEVLTDSGAVSSVTVNEEVLSLSAAGDYLAVLTGNQLTVYNSDLSVYIQTDNSWSARRVLLREDGTALMITNDSAELFRSD